MAGILRYQAKLKCWLMAVLFFFVVLGRKLKQLWTFLVRFPFQASIAISALLAILNITVYAYGCHVLKSHFGPGTLPLGFLPVFPHHYFHKSEVIDERGPKGIKPSRKEPDKLDVYLQGNTLQDSFTSNIPPVIHVVWCDTGPFTFAHYLSVLSVFKVISPSILTLHLLKEPDLDPDGYFQFLPDLQRDIPVLGIQKLQYINACTGSSAEKTVAFLKIIGAVGGGVVNGRIMLAPSKAVSALARSKMGLAVLEGGASESEPIIVTAEAEVLKDIPTARSVNAFLHSHSTKHFKCDNVKSFIFLPQHPCVYMHEDIFPMIIFEGSSHFDYLARWVAYGTSSKLVPHPADKEIVPNIVHYVWLGKNNLGFFGYLSLLSSLYVLKADKVYIHGNYKPMGALWKELQSNPRVKFINRDFPTSVYGEPIKAFASHASDYLRADILLRYGGIYADWDVIFLKEMPQSMRLYNTTANVDWPETGAFPDVFNLGVLVSAPGATFLRHFLESYRWYLDQHWSYNAIHMPYKVYEKKPCSLNIDRHLQVLCADNKCHAPWLISYKQEDLDHLKLINWKTDALAIHWTHPDPVEFESKENLVASNTVVAAIGKHVLNKANVIF